MPARRNIALNLLRFVTILAGAAFAALWRLVMPAADQKLEISHHTLEKLSALRGRPKYVDMPGTIYNGMRPESSRLLAEEELNRLIDGLRKGLPSKPSKKFVLAEFAKTTSEFEASATEDREQLVRYLQEIMDILGIASADAAGCTAPCSVCSLIMTTRNEMAHDRPIGNLRLLSSAAIQLGTLPLTALAHAP